MLHYFSVTALSGWTVLSNCRDHGHREKRLVRLPEVVLQYTAATGLTNQHYCHIAAFSLCAVLAKCSVSAICPKPLLANSCYGMAQCLECLDCTLCSGNLAWSALPSAAPLAQSYAIPGSLTETSLSKTKVTAVWHIWEITHAVMPCASDRLHRTCPLHLPSAPALCTCLCTAPALCIAPATCTAPAVGRRCPMLCW